MLKNSDFALNKKEVEFMIYYENKIDKNEFT